MISCPDPDTSVVTAARFVHFKGRQSSTRIKTLRVVYQSLLLHQSGYVALLLVREFAFDSCIKVPTDEFSKVSTPVAHSCSRGITQCTKRVISARTRTVSRCYQDRLRRLDCRVLLLTSLALGCSEISPSSRATHSLSSSRSTTTSPSNS